MINSIRTLAIVPILLFSAIGCVRTVQPILNDDQVMVDNSMPGKWVSDDGKNTVEIQPAGADDKTYKVAYTDGDGKKGNFLVRLGKIQDTMIAEIRPDDPAPAASDIYRGQLLRLYSFLIVDQLKPQIVVRPMLMDWLIKYLDAHPNELQVIKPKDDLIVSSSTADLQAFLLRHIKDDGALGDKGTLVRPGDPTTRAAAPTQ